MTLNKLLTMDGPIVACSTSRNEASAIAVIRCSGFTNQDQFLSKIFARKSPFPERTAVLSKIYSAEGRIIDEAVVLSFSAPKSYTGEHVLEISIHGNPFNISRILDLFLACGFREALPGEFTYRALKNKKMTLSQVEGLDLLLNSTSSFGLDQGIDLLFGELQREYQILWNKFLQVKAAVEISIDFLEDVGEEQANRNLQAAFEDFAHFLGQLKSRAEVESSGLINATIGLFGPTNSGKSSLFNLLLKQNRSIVTPMAGTTRDYVSEMVRWDGQAFRIVDTAGLRETFDQVEREGIQRSLSIFKDAFFKIVLINPLNFESEFWPKDVDVDLIIFTHLDLPGAVPQLAKIFVELPKSAKYSFVNLDKGTGPIGPMQIFESGSIGPLLFGSNLSGGSIGPAPEITGPIGPWAESLKACILDKLLKLKEKTPILVERQKKALVDVDKFTQELRSTYLDQNDIGIIDFQLKSIGDGLQELIGWIPPDAILGHIFDHFCIGK